MECQCLACQTVAAMNIELGREKNSARMREPLKGLLWFAGGIGATALSYVLLPGQAVFFWGAAAYGVYRLFVGALAWFPDRPDIRNDKHFHVAGEYGPDKPMPTPEETPLWNSGGFLSDRLKRPAV